MDTRGRDKEDWRKESSNAREGFIECVCENRIKKTPNCIVYHGGNPFICCSTVKIPTFFGRELQA